MNENQTEKIAIIGTGYVGLTLGLTLADVGCKVYATDKNDGLLKTLSQGKSHFYEKGIDLLLKKYFGSRFSVGKEIRDKENDVYIISVGTPLDAQKAPNLNYVKSAAEEVGGYLKKGDLVALRSTVPIGTTRNVVAPLLEKRSGLKAGRDFHLVFAPERTIEGKALVELRELPQLIGGIDEASFIRASNLFRRTTHTIINVSSLEGAEMTKIMDNSFRDISFAISNEFALIAERLGLDVVELIKAARIGYSRTGLFVPSPGVGGACLTKDPYIFSHVAAEKGHQSDLLKLGRRINEYMPRHVAEQVARFVDKKKKTGAKVFILGFAFKGHPLTSDMRFSPTEDLVKALAGKGYKLCGHDLAVPAEDIRGIGVEPMSIQEGFKDADAVVLMLNSGGYADLDIFNLLSSTARPSLFYDAWQLYKKEEIRQVENVTHAGVGYV